MQRHSFFKKKGTNVVGPSVDTEEETPAVEQKVIQSIDISWNERIPKTISHLWDGPILTVSYEKGDPEELKNLSYGGNYDSSGNEILLFTDYVDSLNYIYRVQVDGETIASYPVTFIPRLSWENYFNEIWELDTEDSEGNTITLWNRTVNAAEEAVLELKLEVAEAGTFRMDQDKMSFL